MWIYVLAMILVPAVLAWISASVEQAEREAALMDELQGDADE